MIFFFPRRRGGRLGREGKGGVARTSPSQNNSGYNQASLPPGQQKGPQRGNPAEQNSAGCWWRGCVRWSWVCLPKPGREPPASRKESHFDLSEGPSLRCSKGSILWIKGSLSPKVPGGKGGGRQDTPGPSINTILSSHRARRVIYSSSCLFWYRVTLTYF